MPLGINQEGATYWAESLEEWYQESKSETLAINPVVAVLDNGEFL